MSQEKSNKKFINWLLGFILPYRCVVCELKTSTLADLCESCEAHLPWLQQVCLRCQERLPPGAPLTWCGSCLQAPPLFDRLIALFAYEFPIISLMHHLKFSQETAPARVFGELMVKKLVAGLSEGTIEKPEALLPVPLHRRRFAERGYNQAELIALSIQQALKLPLLKKTVIRIKKTEAQSTLTLTARKQNVKNAFVVKKALPYQHIAIIDDVVTSGNTVSELVRVLKNAGIEKIQVWAVCKALREY